MYLQIHPYTYIDVYLHKYIGLAELTHTGRQFMVAIYN